MKCRHHGLVQLLQGHDRICIEHVSCFLRWRGRQKRVIHAFQNGVMRVLQIALLKVHVDCWERWYVHFVWFCQTVLPQLSYLVHLTLPQNQSPIPSDELATCCLPFERRSNDVVRDHKRLLKWQDQIIPFERSTRTHIQLLAYIAKPFFVDLGHEMRSRRIGSR